MSRNKANKRITGVQGVLRKAVELVEGPVCNDILAYRLLVKPILDGLISDQGNHIVPLRVNREKLFEEAIQFYKKANRNNHEKLLVTFVTDGKEEEGKDGNGLRREFYTSFFTSCRQKMFQGRARKSFPSNDMKLVQGGYFEALGRAIVASVMNGDSGFPYLAPAAFHYLIEDDYTGDLHLDHVPDPDIKDLATQIEGAKNQDALMAILESREAAVVDHIGWSPGEAFTMNNKNKLKTQLIRWSMIDKRKHSLDKLKEGLNHLGFLDAMKTNPELKNLLVYSSEYGVSARFIQKTVLPSVESLQCQDDGETNARKYMLELIMEFTDEDAVRFFEFVTGSADPTVENVQITIDFITNKTSKYPEANTCTTNLRIPKYHSSAKDFKKSFKEALAHSRKGFGRS